MSKWLFNSFVFYIALFIVLSQVVQARWSQPNNVCNGNGIMLNRGGCLCNEGYSGTNCETKN